MLNKALLVGRLVKDPEFRSTANGVSVTTFCLAIPRKYKENGERKSDFINCVSFRATADLVQQYCSKGDIISVDGTIQSRTWNDSEGRRNYVTEVIADSIGFVCSAEKKTATSKNEDDGGIDTDKLDFGPDIGDDDLPF